MNVSNCLCRRRPRESRHKAAADRRLLAGRPTRRRRQGPDTQSGLSAATHSSRSPQQKIFEHEFVVAARKRRAAGSAGQLPIVRFRSGFDFDDVVERLAVRARERTRRRRSSRRHTRPHTQELRLIVRRLQSKPANSGLQLSLNCHTRLQPRLRRLFTRLLMCQTRPSSANWAT